MEATVNVTHTQQSIIRCVARQDMPQFNIKAGERFVLQRVSKGVYRVRTIAIGEREELESGSVRYQIRNREGVAYTTTLHRNKVHTCTCLAHTSCYHIDICRRTENARRAERRKNAARIVRQSLSTVPEAQAASRSAQPQTVACQAERASGQPAVSAKQWQNAPLNGNRPFSILRV